jgi:hypothetical protein
VGFRLAAEIAADGVVAVHLAFVLFLLAGGYLAWRWRWLLAAHVPAVAISAVLAVTGADCPLSGIEKWLRRKAGQRPYRDGFVAHYIVQPVHAAGLTPTVATVLRLLTIGVVGIAYLGLLTRRVSRSSPPPASCSLREA